LGRDSRPPAELIPASALAAGPGQRNREVALQIATGALGCGRIFGQGAPPVRTPLSAGDPKPAPYRPNAQVCARKGRKCSEDLKIFSRTFEDMGDMMILKIF
jgi:hypothetical protein